jgi:DNA-binding response OmpR family regulator
VTVERDGKGGLAAALKDEWDLIVLDVMLPGIGGFEMVRKIREAGIETPVLFLSAKGEVHDRVKGLSLGADDYLVKPFSMDELKARLHALGRRRAMATTVAAQKLPQGWHLDSLLREVTTNGRSVPLQPREWSLLELFLDHEGEVLTNSFLLDRVWGIQFDPGTNVINATICRLRRKLDEAGRLTHFETIRGRGHTFRSDV